MKRFSLIDNLHRLEADLSVVVPFLMRQQKSIFISIFVEINLTHHVVYHLISPTALRGRYRYRLGG